MDSRLQSVKARGYKTNPALLRGLVSRSFAGFETCQLDEYSIAMAGRIIARTHCKTLPIQAVSTSDIPDTYGSGGRGNLRRRQARDSLPRAVQNERAACSWGARQDAGGQPLNDAGNLVSPKVASLRVRACALGMPCPEQQPKQRVFHIHQQRGLTRSGRSAGALAMSMIWHFLKFWFRNEEPVESYKHHG